MRIYGKGAIAERHRAGCAYRRNALRLLRPTGCAALLVRGEGDTQLGVVGCDN